MGPNAAFFSPFGWAFGHGCPLSVRSCQPSSAPLIKIAPARRCPGAAKARDAFDHGLRPMLRARRMSARDQNDARKLGCERGPEGTWAAQGARIPRRCRCGRASTGITLLCSTTLRPSSPGGGLTPGKVTLTSSLLHVFCESLLRRDPGRDAGDVFRPTSAALPEGRTLAATWGRLAPRRPRLRLWWGGRVPVPALPTDAGTRWQGVRPPRLLPGAVREAVPISSQSHGAADKPATEPPRPSRTLRYSRQAVRERPDWGWGRW